MCSVDGCEIRVNKNGAMTSRKPEPRAAIGADRYCAYSQAEITRPRVVGYRRAIPRPATKNPNAANVRIVPAQKTVKPANAAAGHTKIRKRWPGSRRMIRAHSARALAMPTKNTEASAGA